MDVVLLSQFKCVPPSCSARNHLTSRRRYYDWKKNRALRRVGSYGDSMQKPLLSDSDSPSSGAVFVSSKGKRAAPALAVALAVVRFHSSPCAASCMPHNVHARVPYSRFTYRFVSSGPPVPSRSLPLLPHPRHRPSLPPAGYFLSTFIQTHPQPRPPPRPPLPHHLPLPHHPPPPQPPSSPSPLPPRQPPTPPPPPPPPATVTT